MGLFCCPRKRSRKRANAGARSNFADAVAGLRFIGFPKGLMYWRNITHLFVHCKRYILYGKNTLCGKSTLCSKSLSMIEVNILFSFVGRTNFDGMGNSIIGTAKEKGRGSKSRNRKSGKCRVCAAVKQYNGVCSAGMVAAFGP